MDRTLDPLRAFARGYRRHREAERLARLERAGPDTTSGRSLTARNLLAATITCIALSAWQLEAPAGCGVAFLMGLFCIYEAPHCLRRANTMLCYWITLGAFAVWPVSWLATSAEERASRARGDEVAAALGRFHAEHRVFPERLAALVPSHLPSVPVTAIGLVELHQFGYGSEPDGSSYELWFHLHHSPRDIWVRDATGSWRRSLRSLLRSQAPR